MRSPRRFVAFVVLFGATLAPAVAHAASKEVGPGDDVEAAMNGLQPGDELLLRGGTYTLTDAWHVSIVGTATAPIVIRAKPGESPHLHRPAVDQNIIDFDKARFVTIRGIEFSGGSAGLRLIDVSDTTIQDCEIHDTDDVAIPANSGSDYARLKLLHNHIHNTGGTGEGMYLGCNSNGCRVHDSLIEGNHIHDTKGPNVSQGDGIEIKEGSYANVVRDNVVHDTGYPCLITYSTVGNGAPNVLERNVLWNCGDHGIQSAADVVIRNNIVLGAAANGIANQPHQAGTPANIQIVHNTIVAPQNDAIASTGITGSVLIANNAVYSKQGSAIRVSGALGGVEVKGNVGVGALSGVTGGLVMGDLATDFVAPSYSGTVPNDVFPKPGSKLIAAGEPAYVPSDDFNGLARGGVADVGAYKFVATGNPGWALAAGFKSLAPKATGGDSGLEGGVGPNGRDGGPGSVTGAPDGNPNANASGAPDTSSSSSGCGCRTAGASSDTSWVLAAPALLMALSIRRGRRPSQRPAEGGRGGLGRGPAPGR